MADNISGKIALYDVNYGAAKNNEIIGNRIKDMEDCKFVLNYKAIEGIVEKLAVNMTGSALPLPQKSP